MSTRSSRQSTLHTLLRCILAGLCPCCLAVRLIAAPAEPTRGLLPKDETGATRFLTQHPEFDGRGVVVAVFDTGVDPGAPGLQTTPDGRPKVIDIIDATGGGDVDTSTVREANDGKVLGLSGRTLKLAPDWKSPDGKFHLGLKRAFELFPEPLVDRIRQKRRDGWNERQHAREAQLQRDLEAWDRAHATGHRTEAETQQRRDLEVRLEQFRAMQKAWEDPGPAYDCIVFHDGDSWRAAVDTTENGDFTDETLLTNYRAERRYGTFGPEALLNFALNIFDDGNLLSIVADSGMHGTHVAGIIAAHFPGQPELNGIAPGAQIVAVKIGDTRLGSMETAIGFTRGIAAVRALKCDVINLSYGEATGTPNRGHIPDLLSELVHEDGVIVVSSAGNEGPALSTVGAPGGTTSALIGVGAYVSPDMMTAAYSMRTNPPETQYTFSARGPAADGAWGVSISAPGGAISPVPNWTLQRSQLANGTSMASPNAAGGVALILSGLKAGHIGYSPDSIRRALENSARSIPNLDPFTQGRGLLQIEPAFETCKALASASRLEPRLEISVPQRQNARGIYLREPQENTRPLEVSVQVTPVFPETTDNHLKVDLERRYRIQSTASWVQAPDQLHLTHGGRAFDVRVDPTALAPGAHAAEVLGFDVESEGVATNAGPAFRLPIAVIHPESLSRTNGFRWQQTLELEPASVVRKFFAVPSGSTWAELLVQARDTDSPRRLVVQTVQLRPDRSSLDNEARRYLTLSPGAETTVRFAVLQNRTLELCLGQVWSSLGHGTFEFTLRFHGVQPDPTEITLDPGSLLRRIEVTAPLHEDRIAPRASLGIRRRVVAPSDTELRPLPSARDQLTKGRILNELLLTYRFTLDEAATVTPRFPALNGRLYDGQFESQLYAISTASGQVLAIDDGWAPGARRLAKGDYVLRFHLRQDRTDWLETLKSLPLALDQELASSVALDCYRDLDAALTGGARFGERTLTAGQSSAFILAAADRDALAKAGKPGDVLLGQLRLEPADGAPDFPVTVVVPSPASPAKPKPAETAQDETPLPERLSDERRDLAVSQLDRLTSDQDTKAFDALSRDLLKQYPAHLPVFVKRLHRVDNDQRSDRLRSVVAAADEIIKRIDTRELATWMGTRSEGDDAKAKRIRPQMTEQRNALTDALYRKGRALAWMELPDDEDASNAQPAKEKPTAGARSAKPEPPFDHATVERLFEANFAELRKWADTTEDKFVLLHIRREWRHQHLGEVLKLLQDGIRKNPTDTQLQLKRIQVLKDLGWTDWADHESQWLQVRFPENAPGPSTFAR